MLTQNRLRELLDYNSDTGTFTWKVRRGGTANVGSVCLCKDVAGYIQIMVDLKNYRGHVLAWLYTHGVIPPFPLDHINGIKDDNRLENLRPSSKEHNSQNLRKANKTNKTGVLGVSKTKAGKFYAQLKHKGRHVLCKTYDTLDEARAAYIVAKRNYHEACTI